MKIGIGTIFYNDFVSLARCLTRIPKEYTVYAIDGKNIDYEDDNKSNISIDGSRELVSLFSNVRLFDAPGLTQAEKRNVYMNEAGHDECDLLMVVDSDHILYGNWKMFKEDLDTKLSDKYHGYQMPIYTRGIHGIYTFGYMIQLFSDPAHIRYRTRHDAYYYKDERILKKPDTPIINGLLQVNNHEDRLQERQLSAYMYKVKNRKREMKEW